MDCDDDDISPHHFQLAGESRSRSSALKPYDFPKFDFDDNLQGQLRFDSLVETEVFLGIQSQEDSQWIEEFSRGSNGMEFNPNSADSCSISRRANVWSEATSSESVEMLLKSVGQEEMIPAASVTPGTNACDDQDASGRPVNSGTELGLRDLDTTTAKNEDLKEHPTTSSCMEEQSLQVECSPLIPEHVESSCEIAQNLTQKSLIAIGGSAIEGENTPHSELKTSDEKSASCAEKGNSSHYSSKNDADCSHVSTLSSTVHADGSHISCNEDGNEQFSIGTGLENEMISKKTGENSFDISAIGNIPCIITKDSEAVNNVDAVEARLDSPKEYPCASCVGGAELKLSGADETFVSSATAAQTGDCELKVLSVISGVKDPLESCPVGSSVDGSNQSSADLYSSEAGHIASSEQKADHPEQFVAGEISLTEDVQISQCQSMISSGKSPLPFKDEKAPLEKGDCDNATGEMELLPSSAENNQAEEVELPCSESSVFQEQPSAHSLEKGDCDIATGEIELLPSSAEKNQSEDVEGPCTESSVFQGQSSAHSPGCAEWDFRQVIEETFSQSKADSPVTGQATSEASKQDGEFPVATGNMGSENDATLTTGQETDSVCADEEVKINDSNHESQNPASGIHEAAIELAPLPLCNVVAGTASCPGFGDMGFIASELSNNDKICVEDNSPSEAEARVSGDCAPKSLSDGSTKSQQFVEKCNDICSNMSPSSEATTSSHLDNPIVNLGCNKSILECSDAENPRKKSDGDLEPPHVAEVDKASCGSPTIISSSEPSQLEKDDQEEPRASEVAFKSAEGSQPLSDEVKGKDLLGDDNSFTFKVNALPETHREPGKSWSPFRDTEKCIAPVVKESLPSGKGKMESLSSPITPRHNSRLSDVEPVHGKSKGASERKGKRASGKGAAKESAKKGSLAKGAKQETSVTKQDKGSNISFTAPSSGPVVQFGHMQSYGNVDASKTKLSATSVPISNYSDPNASALSKSTHPPGFRQPFSDLQQVQLRAQIFVYGSLIQGTAPDEACMVSAFGPSDVGRSSWEQIWRDAVERVHSQKSGNSAMETPVHSQSGVWASDSALKQNSHSSKVVAASVSKVTSKDVPATISSPMIPLSSPLWSISTPLRDGLPASAMVKGPVVDVQQTGAPLQSYQTPPLRSYFNHPAWPSQTCFTNPWLASPQTPVFNSTVRFQPVTMTDTVKLTPSKDTSLPPTSAMKHVSSNSVVHSAGPSPVYVGLSSPHDSKSVSSPDLQSGDSKPRKRKKGPATDPNHSSSTFEAQTLPVVVQNVGSCLASAAIAPANETVIGKPSADGMTVCFSKPSNSHEPDTGKAGICSDEILKHVAEAKIEAEHAAGFATAAVSHCEELWGKITNHSESELTSEAEAKVVSAAAAIAAAASVARAAAAAAKIACNAALQAKSMADEALFPSQISTDVHDIGNASPASILKGGKTSNQSSSVLVAAKEAAKRRVEAASAASKQAENLDAIVKAAELAAAAVSQAGKIVAMGEPLLLSDLVEAGPEGYWKLSQPPPLVAGNLRGSSEKQTCAIGLEEGSGVPGKASKEYSVEKGGSRKTRQAKIQRSERLKDSVDGQLILVDGVTDDKESKLGRDKVQSNGVGSEPDGTWRASNVQNEHDELADSLSDDSIKEGSPVEVFKSGGDLKSAWYSANVLKLEDGKAYVCYSDLSSEGSGNLCEWVCLESDGENAPLLRIAHPSTSLQYQRTRKRRRAALGDYSWCVGDKVDVWIDDCWWEGVVTERNEKDESTLKVHFPAQGDTLTVRAWNLRTSRSWVDGKWVEWSSLRAQNSSDQMDMRQEKRQKLGSPAIATKEDMDVASGKPEDSKLLSLSASERTFDIGKSVKEDSKLTGRRPLRSGQQKEGSRVVFGVPKPTGKKRKFMEVSKQFPASKGDKSKEVADPTKAVKHAVPQGAGSRGWKLPSRNDSRDKRMVEARPRIPGTRKSQRTLPRRDNPGSTSGHDSDSGVDRGTDVEDSVGGDTLSLKVDHGYSISAEAVEAPLSSLLPHSRTVSSNHKSERVSRGKLAPPGPKLRKIDEEKVYTANSGNVGPEGNEPRRSHRRFQPTHRLLEGLQSSMIIPKMPSVSHDKIQRNQNRSVQARGK